MIQFRRVRWFSTIAFLLAMVLTVLGPAPALASAQRASAAQETALESAIRSAGQLPYTDSARGYMERATAWLQQAEADGAPGVPAEVLQNLITTAETAFTPDGRLDSGAALGMLQRSAHEIANRWEHGGLRHPATLGALTDLLLAMRQSADLRLRDLQMVLLGPDGELDSTPPLPDISQADWDQASAALPVAQAAYDEAMAHLAGAELQSAGYAFGLAWQHGRGRAGLRPRHRTGLGGHHPLHQVRGLPHTRLGSVLDRPVLPAAQR